MTPQRRRPFHAAAALAVVLLAVFAARPVAAQPATVPDELRTVAERSGFRATARHAEVVALLDAIAGASPRARRASMGTSGEGRDIPLLVLADPPLGSAGEARSRARSGKLVVLMLGNIHAGEVDGKEALPMLARDLALAEHEPLLQDLVLVFAPIYNTDGNERVAADNRPGQNGPAEGMGIRENAGGLDLNRDFVKLEAPETRALARFLREWDPAVVIDTHTTNGSFHRYTLTYEGPRHPAGDPAITRYVRGELLPAVTSAVSARFNWPTFFYGDFADNHSRWVTYPADPRYGTNYVGLRNRISILTEGYSYAPYEDRVLATRDFVRVVLEQVASARERIRSMLAEADDRVVKAGNDPAAAGDRGDIPIRVRAASDGRATVQGFVEEQRDGRTASTGVPREYDVELMTAFEPVLTVRRPYAYVLPASAVRALETLQRHAIDVEVLREDIEVDAEVYRVDAITRAEQPFQGHRLARIEATPSREPRRLAAGMIVVRCGQRLGTLAAYLLEPESEDGLATWGAFDDQLTEGGEFPVIRVPDPVPLTRAPARPLAEDRQLGRTLDFRTLYESDRRPDLAGSPVRGLAWNADGTRYYQTKDGVLRSVDPRTGRSEPALDTTAMRAALAGLTPIGERAAAELAARAAGSLTSTRDAAFLQHENDLYYVRVDGSAARRLTATPEPEELASFSPDGRFVAFVRAHNLFVVDVATGTERALTTDGSDTIRNGKADWVYFEEVFNRNWRTYWWSPDSVRILFYRTDSSMVPIHTLVDDLGSTQRIETARYPRPGEPNPRVQVGIVSAAGGAPSFVDMSGYAIDGHLITGAGWWSDSSAAYCYVQDRTQTWLDFCRVAPSGGAPQRLFRDTTQAWVEPPAAPVFLRDGSFLVTSERTGWQHLYRYGRDGAELGPVTTGEWEMRSVKLVDQDAQAVYFSGTKDSHIAENLYRVPLAGGEITRLTTELGSHRCEVAPGGQYFIDEWSSRTAPARVAVRGPDGAVIRTIDSNPVYDLETFRLGLTEQFQISMPDGFQVEAAWVKPADFDPAKKYPVWFMTYAGPHSPTISDSWGNGQAGDHALAAAGFVVFRADPRQASGKGAISAWSTYRQLGVPELKDIVDTITWLKSHPWVDGDRIGMSGFSFGGYMTAYAMTHCDLFAAGIAGAPPTDWREYDTIYTERFMLTPQENPEGYEATSVLNAADKLRGRLLLVHGGLDDNVHPSNTWKLVKALQRAGKTFDLAIYPDARHGVGGIQWRRLEYEFQRRLLDGTLQPR